MRKLVAFLLFFFNLAFVGSFPAHEIESLRACNQILTGILEKGYTEIDDVVKSKRELDQVKLRNKITADILEDCYLKVTPEIITRVWNKKTGKTNIESYRNLIRINPEKYKTKEDLEVSTRIAKLIDIMHKTEVLESKYKNPNHTDL